MTFQALDISASLKMADGLDTRTGLYMAGVRAGCVHLCRVAVNTVRSRMASDSHGP